MSLKPDLFEGLRFDLTKPLNHNFALSHSIFLGNMDVPTSNNQARARGWAEPAPWLAGRGAAAHALLFASADRGARTLLQLAHSRLTRTLALVCRWSRCPSAPTSLAPTW